MFTRRHLLFGLAGIPAARVFALPYQEKEPPSFSTGVSVVNIYASVRDRDGKIVTDLTPGDFAIEEDGLPIDIRYFSRDSDLPLVLGMVVDVSGSVRNVIGEEIKAARKFLRQVIREDLDRAFAIRFAHEVELMQGLTSSIDKLEEALDDIDQPFTFPLAQPLQPQRFQLPPLVNAQFPIPFPGGGGPFPGGGGGTPFPFPIPGSGRTGGSRRRPNPQPRARLGTCLHDAIYLGADEVLRPEEGRKAMILISDGIDAGSKVSLSTAIEVSQRADAIVYSIRFLGMNPGGDEDRGVDILERYAEETGGSYFDATGKRPLEKVFASIEEELRHQYSLGISPDTSRKGFRELKVTVKHKGMKVRARQGYYI